MHEHAAVREPVTLAAIWMALLAVLGLLYLVARLTLRRGSAWPWYRSVIWCAGLVVVGAAVIGPVPARGQSDFRWHMVGHVLLGMVAPMGLVMAAPITLALRRLPTARARLMVGLLHSGPIRAITHPVAAAIFNLGGLWLLYATDLYDAMHRHWTIQLFVQMHVLVAGYLFTAAIIGIDPIRDRPSWMMRATGLFIAMAGHAILAKYLFTHPPANVTGDHAERASKVMYYGGDAVEGVMIAIFCWQWYRATRPRAGYGLRSTSTDARPRA